jgi:AAA+ superfamily predicted ATPase
LDLTGEADRIDWAGDEVGIKEIFERARAEAPCLLVLEDLDSLITDENRSFFLNEVDGIDGNDGLLLVSHTYFCVWHGLT